MKAKIYMFTSPTCPHCPPARKFMKDFKKERDDFELFDIVAGTEEAAEKAKEFNVNSVPTFIIQGPGYKDNIGIRGTPSKEKMNKYIDLSYGIEHKKPSFREKLNKGIKIGKFRIKF